MYKQGLFLKRILSSTRRAGLKQISRVGRSRYIADIRHLCGAGKESKQWVAYICFNSSSTTCRKSSLFRRHQMAAEYVGDWRNWQTRMPQEHMLIRKGSSPLSPTILRYVQQSITDRLRELVHCRCKSYLPDQTALVVHRCARRLKKAEGNGSIPVSGSISGSGGISRRAINQTTYLVLQGINSAARVLALQARSRGFDPHSGHQKESVDKDIFCKIYRCSDNSLVSSTS